MLVLALHQLIKRSTALRVSLARTIGEERIHSRSRLTNGRLQHDEEQKRQHAGNCVGEARARSREKSAEESPAFFLSSSEFSTPHGILLSAPGSPSFGKPGPLR